MIGTILLENIPQLACQALYTVALQGEMTEAVQFAFVASSLSIIASTLGYLIERDTSDTTVVQYYLSTQCSLRGSSGSGIANAAAAAATSDDEKEFGMEKQLTVFTKTGGEILVSPDVDEKADITSRSPSPSSACNTNGNIISEEEKKCFMQNRGRTSKLGDSLAGVYEISAKNIEVGHSMLTKHGIITHIVHYVYDDEIERLHEELMNESGKQLYNVVTPKLYVSQLFESVKDDIFDI